MKIYHIPENIVLYTVTAQSFPAGVGEAFEQLHLLISEEDTNGFYSISNADATGKIIYKAAVALNKDCTNIPALEMKILPAGKYRGIEFKNFRKRIADIGQTFQELINYPDIDKNGCCVELYHNDIDVQCMVKIADDYATQI